MDTKLYRVEQAAKALGICRSKAFRLIRDGDLRSVLIGGSRRVPESAVDEFIESRLK